MVELIEGWGGVFEIAVGENLIFSKKQSGRFPTWGEVRAGLRGGA